MNRFEGKVALITGAAQGIGYAIASQLAREGSRLAIADVSEATLKESAAALSALGAEVLPIVMNVAVLARVEEGIDKILDKFGAIDILINNAGITRDNLLLRMKEEEWDSVINVNLKGTFNCSKIVCRGMLKRRTGHIVNLASVVGIMGNAGQANYAASKAGVIGLTKALAKEFSSRGVTVNAVAPGFITTAMTAALPEGVRAKLLEGTPLGRFGTVEDVAAAVLFLASSEANYITGHVLAVDGGLAM